MEKATITKSVLMKKTRTHGEINLKEIKTEGGVMKMIGGNGNKKMAFEPFRRKSVAFQRYEFKTESCLADRRFNGGEVRS